jgi:hypothetical protein
MRFLLSFGRGRESGNPLQPGQPSDLQVNFEIAPIANDFSAEKQGTTANRLT